MRLQRVSNEEILTLDVTSTVGQGGEARIYAVPQNEALVAKIYHKPTVAYAHKLVAMLANPPENPLSITSQKNENSAPKFSKSFKSATLPAAGQRCIAIL